MPYTKNTWEDRYAVGDNKFSDQNGTIYEFTPAPDSVEIEGTPIQADWLNNMEDGIETAVDLAEASVRYIGQGTNVDSLTTTGLYYCTANTSGMPTTGGYMLVVLMANGRGTQIATINGTSSNMWIRSMLTGSGGGWQAWRKIVTADMFSFSGGTLTITTN